MSELEGLVTIDPVIHGDDRGFFFESYNRRRFADDVGVQVDFVQDNHSKSARGVLRGLHYQVEPHAQGKLVRVVVGAIWDVAVDIRRSSSTFGRWEGYQLSAHNKRQLWIPAGFAHGFVTLSEEAELVYKTTDYYAPECDRSIRWDDPDIAITWPVPGDPILSPKDAAAPPLTEVETFA